MVLRHSLYWLNYFVVRWQFVLTVLAVWLGAWWLKSHYADDNSNLWLVMQIFLQLLKWTLAGLFAMSLLLALGCWAIFVLGIRNRSVSVQIQLGDGVRAEAGRVPLRLSLTGPVIRPLLGTIRARLIFAGKKLSEPVILDSDYYGKKGMLRKGIRGTSSIVLHDRGIYDVEKVHVIFCDMFNLIALPANVPVVQQLFTLPKAQPEKPEKAQPNTTEEQTHRIDIPKRVEGEYVNYKEFETGDNIRRIVWQIYAKSGELVVRIPETKDPYASHLYFYISFFDSMGLNQGFFDSELLNVYKDKVRNLFEGLQKNGYHIRLPQDQEVPRLPGLSDKKNELFQITAANWQVINPPSTFVDPAKAAFVCLSALVSPEEVELLLKKLPESTPVVVIKLSEAIPSPFRFNVKDIFFSPEEQPYDKLRKPWFLSALRRKLMKNEEAVEGALKRRGNSWVAKALEVA